MRKTSERIIFTLNGEELSARAGQSVLSAALEQGRSIPHLCAVEGLSSGGGCGLCLMEVRGRNGLMRSCSTLPWDGMCAETNTQRVRRARQGALALLLGEHDGDCAAPCTLACPAHIDCQSFLRHIADGDMQGAFGVLMKSLPVPGAVGLVCAQPCGRACRRGLVDRPVNIGRLQVLAAEENRRSAQPWRPEREDSTGKRAAVVGGGACGLTAAWFLALAGHEVTLLDEKPLMGGSLRDALAENQDGQALLDWEIEQIAAAGVKMEVRHAVSSAELDVLLGQYDAVLLTMGARGPDGEAPPAPGGFSLLESGAFSAYSLSVPAAAAGTGAAAAAGLDAYLKGAKAERKPRPCSRRRVEADTYGDVRPAEEVRLDCERPAQDVLESEAGRCMSCGCGAYPDCGLLRCANELSVRQSIPELRKARPDRGIQPRPGGMAYDAGKCIRCGICVRTCEEIAGKGMLSFVGRGMSVRVLALPDTDSADAVCGHCRRCSELCPTGALTLRDE